jgi:hypothetical protein
MRQNLIRESKLFVPKGDLEWTGKGQPPAVLSSGQCSSIKGRQIMIKDYILVLFNVKMSVGVLYGETVRFRQSTNRGQQLRGAFSSILIV